MRIIARKKKVEQIWIVENVENKITHHLLFLIPAMISNSLDESFP
ncbi:MAG: hypothetical protein ACI8RD_001971 [Bacillariaceae sp.]|jgi:hypothetical protein